MASGAARRAVRDVGYALWTLSLTNAVSSCGLDMSEAGFAGLVPFDDGARVGPLGVEEPVDGRDGVTDGVTFSGRAADDGGGMAGRVRGGLNGDVSAASATKGPAHLQRAGEME